MAQEILQNGPVEVDQKLQIGVIIHANAITCDLLEQTKHTKSFSCFNTLLHKHRVEIRNDR